MQAAVRRACACGSRRSCHWYLRDCRLGLALRLQVNPVPARVLALQASWSGLAHSRSGLATLTHRAPVGKGRTKTIVMIDNRSIPEYDLSYLPAEFGRLRECADSGPKEWATAIQRLLGPQSVTIEADKYLVVCNGMGVKFQQSTKRRGFHGSHKKYLLNALCHMEAFGPVPLKY
mmetsp:Transcript_88032/g.284976  ORF Transcript_88032/g.284976 Transcript_88032/m.284976 type:complete len:175 (-) Transcript_88032:98-622(-)